MVLLGNIHKRVITANNELFHTVYSTIETITMYQHFYALAPVGFKKTDTKSIVRIGYKF